MAIELLRQVKVASPCHVSWNEMSGDERVRFCGSCKLNVFNLSDMTDNEAEQLLRKANGRLCVRYFQRSDGTVMTRNCPVGLAAIRRRVVIGLLSAATLMIASFGLAVRSKDLNASGSQTPQECSLWDRAYKWLVAEPEPSSDIRGEVMVGALPSPPSPGKP